jgi:UDP-2-acetamido-3-amino-2,3-dideoxy-glucuronate N-acetyltransferase
MNTIQKNKTPGIHKSQVRGVTRHVFNTITDARGSLSVGEFEREIPFIPKRYFLVFDVPTGQERGEHAHIQCQQFLIATKGSINVTVDDGKTKEEFILDHPSVGLYLPPMTWGTQRSNSADAVLLVLASDYYEANDYVRDYENFIKLVEKR